MNFKIVSLLLSCLVVSLPGRSVEFAIIAPTYNNMIPDPKTGRPFCVEHIESIGKQKYPHSLWHAYCIDDCSNDGTGEMLKQKVQQLNLQDVVTVHINAERKKALYNIWLQIHELPDDTIIITQDGDDVLPSSHVLSRLAQEYQDPNVWLTYGQFKHYPSGALGHCGKFPDDVIRNRKFRQHSWISSHIRTFRAGLFKKIKLEDLVSDGQFYPMTWDQAFMFPMLEMASKGHFRFIPDVLYLYKETPRNDYKVDYSLMARLEKEIRSKKRYGQLDVLPAQKTPSLVDLIVFSKDRPLQLYAHLESVYACLKNIQSVQVIYHAVDNDYAQGYEVLKKQFPEVMFVQQSTQNPRSDFKTLTMQALDRCTCDYMMFAVDDIIVKDHCDLKDCTKALQRTHAYAFYLRLGTHTTECYAMNQHQGLPQLIPLYDDVYAWKFSTGVHDWRYPHSVDMTIVRTKSIKKQFAKLNFHSPNTLEAQWSMKAPFNKFGLCFETTKMVNLPLNLVQTDYTNRAMQFSAKDLHKQFKKGKKIDIQPLFGIKNKAAHMEYIPTFIDR